MVSNYKKKYKDQKHTCEFSGEEFELGKSSIRSGVAPKYYPLYRRAYNLIAAARWRARQKDIEFDLTPVWCMKLLSKPCPMTNFNYDLEVQGKDMSSRTPWSPSIDRINPKKGYTMDNCRVVAWWYNCAKQTFSDNEVLELCRAVVNKAKIC